MNLVVPAVLPTSSKDLDEKLSLVTRIPLVDRVQIDVVDGSFAAPASWPYTAPKELHDRVRRNAMLPALDRLEYEIDLMCFDAENAARAWLSLGATRLTFHAKSAVDVPRMLASARKRYGSFVSFGLALDIADTIALLEPFIGELSYVQFMGIAHIGRQGEPFDKRVYEKVRTFHAWHPEVAIQVDGGISLESARKLIALDVANLVIGSAILRAKDPAAAVEAFEALATPYGV